MMAQQSSQRQLSSEEWDAIKPFILRLYVEEKETLRRVIQIVSQDNGLLLTKRQLTRKFDLWNIHKNARPHNKLRARRIPTLSNNIPAMREHNIVRSFMIEGEYPTGSAQINNVFGLSAVQYDNHIPNAFSSTQQATSNVPDLHGVEINLGENNDMSCVIYSANDLTQLPNSADIDESGGFGVVEILELLTIETKSSLSIKALTELFGKNVIHDPPFEFVDPTALASSYGGPDVSKINHVAKKQHRKGNHNARSDIISPSRWNQHTNFAQATTNYLNPSLSNEVYPFVSFSSSDNDSGPSNQIRQMYTMKDVRDDPQYQLALSLAKQKKSKRAESIYRSIINSTKYIASSRALDVELDLLESIIDQGRPEEAFELHAGLHLRIISDNPMGSHIVRRSLLNRARIFARLNDVEAAETTCREMVQIALGFFGPRDLRTLRAVSKLAHYKKKQHRYGESVRLYSMTIQLQYELRSSSRRMNQDLRLLATLLNGMGQTLEAIELVRKLAKETLIVPGAKHRDTAIVYRRFGLLLGATKHYEESCENQQKSVSLFTELYGEENLWTVDAMQGLGQTLSDWGRDQKAVYWLKKSLTGYLDLGITDKYALGSLKTLSRICRGLKLFEDLRQVCELVAQYLRGDWERNLETLGERQLLIALKWMRELGWSFGECGKDQEGDFWIKKADSLQHKVSEDHLMI